MIAGQTINAPIEALWKICSREMLLLLLMGGGWGAVVDIALRRCYEGSENA